MLFDAYKTLLGLYADMTASTMDITALIEAKIRAVAGIGALVYIFSRLVPQVMRSEPIDFFPYLRPFMLMVLIGLSPRICNGIDKLGESIRSAVERQNGTLYEKIAEQTKLLQQTVDAKWQEIGEHPELFRQVDPSFDPDAFGSSLKLSFAEYSEKFKYELLSYTQDILLALMQAAHERGDTEVLLHAQRSAEGFYCRLGFEGQGEPYEEAGIPHLTMRRALNGPRA